jgi:hypothetical protein
VDGRQQDIREITLRAISAARLVAAHGRVIQQDGMLECRDIKGAWLMAWAFADEDLLYVNSRHRVYANMS